MENTEPTQEAPVQDAPVQETPAQETPIQEAPKSEAPKSEVDVTKIQKEAFKHALNQIDEVFVEYELEKPAGVKTSDYLRQILGERGTKKTTEQVKTSDAQPSADEKAQLEQLKALLQEKDNAIAELKNSTSKVKKELFVDSLLEQAPLNIPEGVSDPEKVRMKGILKNALKSELEREYEFKEVDGQYRAYHKDGRPVLDDKADFLNPSNLIEKNFSAFLAKKQSPTTPKGTGGGAEPQSRPSVIPAGIKTRAEFYDHLSKKGMVQGSKQFFEEVSKAKEENPAMFT